MVSRILGYIGIAGLLATTAACGDSTGLSFDPLIATDTVELAAPVAGNETLPTALSIAGNQLGGIEGAVFPESSGSAARWDFLLRFRDGRLALVPGGDVGLDLGSSITPALTGETLESLREAPGQTTFDNVAVPLNLGAVYAARSRVLSNSCNAHYGKISPLSLDQTTGRATLIVVTNARCGDPRLVEE